MKRFKNFEEMFEYFDGPLTSIDKLFGMFAESLKDNENNEDKKEENPTNNVEYNLRKEIVDGKEVVNDESLKVNGEEVVGCGLKIKKDGPQLSCCGECDKTVSHEEGDYKLIVEKYSAALQRILQLQGENKSLKEKISEYERYKKFYDIVTTVKL